MVVRGGDVVWVESIWVVVVVVCGGGMVVYFGDFVEVRVCVGLGEAAPSGRVDSRRVRVQFGALRPLLCANASPTI